MIGKSLEKMNTALKEYFNPESSYFRSCVQFKDTLLALKEGLAISTVNLEGIGQSRDTVIAIFNECKKAAKVFADDYKTAQHYFVKIGDLDREKRAKEAQGRALDGKSLERLSRVNRDY